MFLCRLSFTAGSPPKGIGAWLRWPGIRNVPNTEPRNAFPERSEHGVCPVLLSAPQAREFFFEFTCEFLAD